MKSRNLEDSVKIVVTGGAGFIGSNLTKKLCSEGHDVIVIDDLSSGYLEHLRDLSYTFKNINIKNNEIVNDKVFENVDVIYHLAADVDNRFSWEKPYLGIESNVIGTLNIGLAARNFQIPKIVYASSGTIYGDNLNPPFKESDESSTQTTLYGSTKYSAEGLLSVFSTHFGTQVIVHRFVGVLGPHSSHGHIFDFMKKIKNNPESLKVLGNGYQKKSYIHVEDVLNGITSIQSDKPFEVFNLGRSDYSTVRDSVTWLLKELNSKAKPQYEENDRGWTGDNPFLQLDVSKALTKGWLPKFTIEEAVTDTIRWLNGNPWIFDR